MENATDTLRVRSLIIEDGEGRDRIRLLFDGLRPVIELLDEQRRTRLELAVDEHDAWVAIDGTDDGVTGACVASGGVYVNGATGGVALEQSGLYQ